MREKSKTNLAIAIIFIFFILVPLALQALPFLPDAPAIEEKRDLAKWPKFTWNDLSSYPGKVEIYFNDNFAIRNFLIKFNNTVRLNIFSSSGSPKVLVGKDGWLFYHGEEAGDGASFSNHLGLLPYGYDEIFMAYRNKLQIKKEYLARMGINYVFVIAPDKWSIYPEYLPKGFENNTRQSNTDILVDYLRRNTTVDILDLREPLRSLKSTGQMLYYRSDTHWNELGGYYAYYEIAKHISGYYPDITPRNINDFMIKEIEVKGTGELGKMLALKDYHDIDYQLNPKTPYSYSLSTDENDIRSPQIYYKTASSLPRALVFRDSFMLAVMPYLSDDFSAITYLWNKWEPISGIDPWLQKVRPNVVVEEIAERYLLPGVVF